MESSPVFSGVDVAKARLDVASTDSDETWSVSNAADGIALLVKRLREIGPTLVVMAGARQAKPRRVGFGGA